MPALSRPRTPKVCTCLRVRHVHGTYTSYASCGCGCDPCRAAGSAYRAEAKNRTADHARFVPVGPVREHILMLRSHGIGGRRLSELTGVPIRLIQAVVTGNRGARYGRLHTVNRAAADAILAVRPSPALVSEVRQIDATGTRRRLQALAALGWSRAELARRAGLTPTTAGKLMTADWCTLGSARRVHALYEQLWDQQPPATTTAQRTAITRALADAHRRGFAPPMAWDDDTIENPNAHPVGLPDGRVGIAGRLDELVFLVESGVDRDTASRRVGYASWDSARQVAQRRGHRAVHLTTSQWETAA